VFNGGSSIMRVDNSESSPAAGGGTTIGSSDTFGIGSAGHISFEFGVVAGTISATRAALAANMMAHYSIT
jgi:hypothetical protein